MTLQIPQESYISLEFANDYHRLRNSVESWSSLTDEQKARRLVSASDFLDHYYVFAGQKLDPLQPRQFPREASGEIPNAICYAVCELALQTDLTQNQAQKMASVRVGPVSVNYDDQHEINRSYNRFEYVKRLLEPLLEQKTGCGQVLLQRG